MRRTVLCGVALVVLGCGGEDSKPETDGQVGVDSGNARARDDAGSVHDRLDGGKPAVTGHAGSSAGMLDASAAPHTDGAAGMAGTGEPLEDAAVREAGPALADSGVDAGQSSDGGLDAGANAGSDGGVDAASGGTGGTGGTSGAGAGGASGAGAGASGAGAGGSAGQPACVEAGELCGPGQGACCDTYTCTDDAGDLVCAADCTAHPQCVSGCCAPSGAGNFVCSPPSYCDGTPQRCPDLILRGNDGAFLGVASSNRFQSDGVCNEFSNYGNEFGSSSIYNQFGNYGSEFSSKSAYNQFTSTPPVLYCDTTNEVWNPVTKNGLLQRGIDPDELCAVLAESGY